ncbi:MAG: hydroxylamine oxidoreductase [gamma proteobacterium symbiont of Bathyaustriella thionipta]|nr:hydroxylamine oxidoreductase [gamma proteobacterium symbiont of Bathyaustriella thionipta]
MLRSILAVICLVTVSFAATASVKTPPSEMSKETKKCVACHKKKDPGLVQMWGSSKHYRAKVGCFECHQADAKDADAFKHKKGKQPISIIVSPKDCSNCHEKEVKEVGESHHAAAGNILGSLDNLLAEVIEGNSAFITEGFPQGNSAAAVNGCWQCHGAPIKVLEDGKLDPATWPNTGIGRINPDGSKGACTACHQRHEFSVAQARHPDTCGKCHLGPDHPQKEIYEESKHGISFFANIDKMNLDNEKWIPGEDYYAAPTCATCHMSATRKQNVTHDVGMRISWNNRPPVSVRPEVSDKKMGLPGASVNWETRRDNMKDVCSACHNDNFVDGFYQQYDGLVELYNEKYGKPGGALYKAAKPLLKPAKFSNKLDWIWFELWHHEGRRARHAASMQAPDYTHWHGTYDLAKHMYTKMVPEVEHLIAAGLASKDARKIKAAKHLKAELNKMLNSKDHKWYLNKMDAKEKARRKKAAADFKARYK